MGIEKFQLRNDESVRTGHRTQKQDLYDYSAFKARNVACVVHRENTFSGVLWALEHLGFEAACSNSLDAVFKVVSEDPEEWALIIVRLDQPLDEARLESYVRLLRMMDVRIPILVMAGNGKSPEEVDYPKLYGDCVVAEPKSVSELSKSIGAAVKANRSWGARFDDFRREAFEGFRRKL